MAAPTTEERGKDVKEYTAVCAAYFYPGSQRRSSTSVVFLECSYVNVTKEVFSAFSHMSGDICRVDILAVFDGHITNLKQGEYVMVWRDELTEYSFNVD